MVGWYHSHPLCQPDPSLRDIDCQMHHQLSMKGPGGIYLPCVGLILCQFSICYSFAKFLSFSQHFSCDVCLISLTFLVCFLHGYFTSVCFSFLNFPHLHDSFCFWFCLVPKVNNIFSFYFQFSHVYNFLMFTALLLWCLLFPSSLQHFFFVFGSYPSCFRHFCICFCFPLC